MPCFLSFPYAQGRFCRAVNQIYADEGSRARNYEIVLGSLGQYPMGAADLRDLSERFRDGKLPLRGLEEQKKIEPEDTQHFLDHWLAQGAPVFDPAYGISEDEIARVMCEGYRRAILEACKFDPPLPISVAWICNGSDDARFEMVTIVNPRVHVQVLIVTPPSPPDWEVPPSYESDPDNVFVTRLMRTQADIEEIEDGLKAIHAPQEAQRVLNHLDEPAQAEDVGTFRIWT